MTILSLDKVHKHFGITEIIRGVSLDIIEGEKHAIIGPNGAGRSRSRTDHPTRSQEWAWRAAFRSPIFSRA